MAGLQAGWICNGMTEADRVQSVCANRRLDVTVWDDCRLVLPSTHSRQTGLAACRWTRLLLIQPLLAHDNYSENKVTALHTT